MQHIPRTHFFPRWLVSILIAGGLTTCFLLIAARGPVLRAQEPAATPARIDVIRSDAQAVELEFHLGGYTLANLEQAGVPYQQLLADGMAQTAAADFPQAPTLGAMIGIPSAEGVTVEVVAADVVELTGIHLPPAPQYALAPSAVDTNEPAELVERFDPQPVWAATDGWLPNAVVTVGQTGTMAAQPVAQIQFTPVQYNPLRQQLKLYTRIRARVTWSQSPALGRTAAANPARMALWRSVLANDAAVLEGRMQPQTVAASASAVRTGAAQANRRLDENRLAKIMVAEDGIYRVSARGLADKGVPFAAGDFPRFALMHGQTEIPIEVHAGDDGQFNADDYLLFYGTKIRDNSKLPGMKPEPCGLFNDAKPDHWYTEENVYWLMLLPDGQKGARMDHVDGGAEISAPPAHSFRLIRHFEEDTPDGYWQTLPGQECAERWFWKKRLVGLPDSPLASRPYTLMVGAHVTSTALVSITLKGYSTVTHPVSVWVNDLAMPPKTVRPQKRQTLPFAAPLAPTSMQTVTVQADVGEGPPGSNQIYVDSFDVDYQQRYSATTQNEFVFGKNRASEERIRVEGLPGDAALFDITQPLTPTRVMSTGFDGGLFAFSSAASAVSQMIPCQGNLYWGRCYLAVTQAAFKSPTIEAAPPTIAGLTSSENQAEYVIITQEDFVSAAQELADYRSITSGLSSRVVTMADLYDAFNAGVANPVAIRNFLDYAYHCWDQEHKLAYVLLLGDANQDYKNRRGDSRNYVPSFNFESSLFGEISSDSWFANMAADDAYDCATQTAMKSARDALPDLFMGRIPITNTAGAEAVIAKIKTYEQTPPGTDWTRNILFVSDDEKKFRTTVDLLTSAIPTNAVPYNFTSIEVLDKDEPGGQDVPQQAAHEKAYEIADAINKGQLLVTYIGHGDHNAWGRWDAAGANEYHYIFHTFYLYKLTETQKLPIVTVGNCLNGFFAGPPANPALAERLLLQPDSGAVAVWAPTGLGYPSGHRELLGDFNDLILGLKPPSTPHSGRALGVAAQIAMIKTIETNLFWQELATTYVLFGDPALRIRTPSMSYLPLAIR